MLRYCALLNCDSRIFEVVVFRPRLSHPNVGDTTFNPAFEDKPRVRFTYNEESNVIMTVTGSTSQMRGSEYLARQAAVSRIQTDGSEQKFSVLKNL